MFAFKKKAERRKGRGALRPRMAPNSEKVLRKESLGKDVQRIYLTPIKDCLKRKILELAPMQFSPGARRREGNQGE